MEYLKLQASFTTGMAWRLATPAARGAAVSLLMFAARSGLPGRIPACMEWTTADWMAAADLDDEYVQQVVDNNLARWEGDDLVLAGFDHHGFEQLQVQRRQGPHGVKGGRPRTPRVSTTDNPKGLVPISPSPDQSRPDQSTQVGTRASAPASEPTDPTDITSPRSLSIQPVLVVQNCRPPIGDLDRLRHVGAFIGREEAGAWQLLVDDLGLDAVAAAVVAVKGTGKIPYLSAVTAHCGTGNTAEYVVIDGEKIRVTKRPKG